MGLVPSDSPPGICLALWSSRCSLKANNCHGFHGFPGFYEGATKGRCFLQTPRCRQQRRHHWVCHDTPRPYANESVKSVAAFERARHLPPRGRFSSIGDLIPSIEAGILFSRSSPPSVLAPSILYSFPCTARNLPLNCRICLDGSCHLNYAQNRSIQGKQVSLIDPAARC